MKKIFLPLFLLFFFINFLSAQTIVGIWKTISNVIEELNGKQKDLAAMQQKQFPCMTELQTVFEANGKQIMKSPSKCGLIDYNKLPASTWKMKKNIISITNAAMPTPLGITATYTLEFIGDNKVVFTHEYTNEERIKMHTPKVKKVMITYVRT